MGDIELRDFFPIVSGYPLRYFFSGDSYTAIRLKSAVSVITRIRCVFSPKNPLLLYKTLNSRSCTYNITIGLFCVNFFFIKSTSTSNIAQETQRIIEQTIVLRSNNHLK